MTKNCLALHVKIIFIFYLFITLWDLTYSQESIPGRTPTEPSNYTTLEWVFRLTGICLLVLATALFAGLTLGLMSLDKIGLEIIIGAGETVNATLEEKKQANCARRVATVRDDGNLLLTTLVLGNVAANCLLSILMADLTNGLLGFLVSTIVIVIFGEIIPQSVCSRYPLVIGAKSVPLVKIIIILFYIIAKPIAMILDKLLGKDIGTVHTKLELEKMLEIHMKQKAIDSEEVDIMHGAMRYKAKTVRSIMTPASQVFMLPITAKLGYKTIRDIYKAGFSRIPVWGKDKNDIVGLLFVKDLIFLDPEEETTVFNFIQIFGRSIHKVWPDSKLGDILKLFKKGSGHLALVQDVNNQGPGDPFYELLGVVTLEDVVEEILQDEILDEMDTRRSASNNKSNFHFDYGRLRLLDARICDDKLTAEECTTVAEYLFSNFPQFKQKEGSTGRQITVEDIKNLLTICEVIEYGDCTTTGREISQAGVPTNVCSITLDGKIQIVNKIEKSSKVSPPTVSSQTINNQDVIISDLNAYAVLNAEALLAPDGSYIPDFSAFVVPGSNNKVRAVKIARVDFQQILYPLFHNGYGGTKSFHRFVNTASSPAINSYHTAAQNNNKKMNDWEDQNYTISMPVSSSYELENKNSHVHGEDKYRQELIPAEDIKVEKDIT